MFVSNHPYEGGLPHVSDMAFVAPVFADGKIVAFTGSIAHKADVGGTIAGSTSANATEMFQEGLLLPPDQDLDGGKPLPDIERIILANSAPARPGARRHPRPDRGDAEWARRASRNCACVSARPRVTDAFAAILKGAADELRARHRQIARRRSRRPKGCSTAMASCSTKPIKLAVTIRDRERRSRASTSPPAIRRRAGPSICARRWSRPACSTRCIGSPRPEPAFQRRHARRGATSSSRRARSPTPRRRQPVSNYQMVNLKLVDVHSRSAGAGSIRRAPIANAGSSSALSIAWSQGPARPVEHAVRDHGLGLWRRDRP